MIFDEMKSKYGQKVKFISIHKVKLPFLNFLMVKLILTFFLQLNQDVLEIFFHNYDKKEECMITHIC